MMNHPPFQGIPSPQVRPPEVQIKGVASCPMGCEPNWCVQAIPKPGPEKRNAMGRCFMCLTYWEVTVGGKIVNLKDAMGNPVILPAKEK